MSRTPIMGWRPPSGFTLEVAAGVSMRLFQGAALFAISIVLARSLGVSDFGVYSYALSWLMLAVTICQLGFPAFITREVAASHSEGRHGEVRGVLILANRALIAMSILTGAVVYLLGHFGLANAPDLRSLLYGLPIIFLLAQVTADEASVRGLGRVVVAQFAQFLVRPSFHLLALAILILLPSLAVTPEAAMICQTAAIALAFAASVLVRRKTFASVPRCAPVFELGRWVPSVLRLAVIGVIGALITLAGPLLVGGLSTETETGYYAVAAQVTGLITTGMIVVNSQQAPALAAAFAKGDLERLQGLATRACRYSLALALPVSAPLIFASGWVVTTLYGASYAPAAPTFVLLAIGQLVNASVGSVATLLISGNREISVLASLALGVALQLILCFLLVPRFGSVGAAVAGMTTMMSINVGLLIVVYRSVGVLSLPFRFRGEERGG